MKSMDQLGSRGITSCKPTAKATDLNVGCAIANLSELSAREGEKLAPAEDLPRMLDEHAKKLELGLRKRNQPAIRSAQDLLHDIKAPSRE